MEGNEVARTQLSQTEERQLIARAQAGDGAAMERMALQYLPLARAAGGQRYARSIAEDATAAAMEELVRSVLAFDAERGVPFAAFAKVRVYGAVSHLFRKASARWGRECVPETAEACERVADDDAFGASEARLTVAQLLSALTDEERRVVHLLYEEGRTTYEAAELLGLSQSKVVRLKRQALVRMKGVLTSSVDD
ncbi:MAG: sigma-70 family RNA polymerase sigma factor [Selenomonas sp.]|uniref:sigma-70 family RNA polymerase sigma factor n=1 Tax=Selenomonas sp. TaxID=2053611 RepID=UPI0025FA645E|nr:sigma-70 family RNA polymerase sigma factor [Selenomonas sp.]MCI6233235.1 sigma-70 family RNA polymerase sigma factor [Selenomonas sp.]